MPEVLAQRNIPTEIEEPQKISTDIHPTTIGEKPLEKRQYIAELLEIGEASNQFKMPNLIKEIDSFVLDEIRSNKLELSKESYKEIIDGFIKKLNISDKLDVYTKIERLASLIRIQKKLIEAAKEREELLATPAEEMTSKQLKEYINAINDKRHKSIY